VSVSSLEDKGQTESLSPFVRVKINGIWNILEQSKFYTLTGLDKILQGHIYELWHRKQR